MNSFGINLVVYMFSPFLGKKQSIDNFGHYVRIWCTVLLYFVLHPFHEVHGSKDFLAR